MRIVGFDVESFLIRGGLLTPQLVCLSWAEGDREGLLDCADGADFFEACLDDPTCILVAHNAPFDVAVCLRQRPSLLPKIIAAYEAGRIRCTLVRQKLIDISNGEHKYYWDATGKLKKSVYDLRTLVLRHFGRYLAKGEDTWRLRYSELWGVPISEYPPDAASYAIRDAREALDTFLSQNTDLVLDEGEVWPGTLPDEVPQECAQFALHMMSAWGFRADPERVAKLRKKAQEIRDVAYEKLLKYGLVRWKGTRKNPHQKLSKNMKAIYAMVEEVYTNAGLEVPLTEKKKVSTDKETLEYFAQRAEDDDKKPVEGFYDERCEALLESSGNILTTWVPALEQACIRPSNPGYNVLVESGRTSCNQGGKENPSCNVQNPPRKGGVRECIIARPGFVLAGCDYDTIELRTLAQCCLDLLGHSALAIALQNGEDPHSSYAAMRANVDYDEFVRRMKEGDKESEDGRQAAKPANFGFPGGLGPKTYVEYAKGYGQFITLEEAKEAREFYMNRWPEMREYFRFIAAETEVDAPLIHLGSGRVCGKVRYTKRANGYFQGRAADGAKAAMWALFKECYAGWDTVGDLGGAASPLLGSRPILFLHDEFILEVPEATAHLASARLQKVMEFHMQKWIPDIPAKASAVLMRRWFKGSKPAFVVVDGVKRMVPSKPEKKTGADGKEKTVWVPDIRSEEKAVAAA